MRTFAQKPKAHQQTNSAASARRSVPQDRNASSIRRLQRSVGNHGMQQLAAALAEKGNGNPTTASKRANSTGLLSNGTKRLAAGDLSGEAEGVAIGGDTDVQTQPQVVGGDTSSISTSDLFAPQWKNNGEFKWWISWTTNGTSGWIVQKIENNYSGTRANGSAVTNATVGAAPSYYEAWAVDAAGGITGSLGATGNRDRWERPSLGALGSQTSFSMKGTVYWTKQDPAASGFTSGGVADAGSLLASTSAPAGLSAALLTRRASGLWAKDGSQIQLGCFAS